MLTILSDPMSFLLTTLMILPGIVIGISLHEFAHAWMSDKLGDPTPRNQGRLTVSPFAHIDPWGFVMFLLFRFGYGRPVMINPAYYKHRKRDEILVSLAGVTMNLLIAFVMMFVYVFVQISLHMTNPTILSMIWLTAVININLIIFNLLPIPPLDGYKVLRSLFLHKNINFFWKLDQYGYLVLLVVLATGILTPLLSAVTSFVIKGMLLIIGLVF